MLIFQIGGYTAFLTVAPATGRPVDMDDLAPSPFEIATAELRRLGITLARLPGEYRVNFQNGTDATAQIAETLDQALAAGRIMAAERTEASSTKGQGPRRRRPRRMTPKAYNKRLRLAQMRRLRARALRKLTAPAKPTTHDN